MNLQEKYGLLKSAVTSNLNLLRENKDKISQDILSRLVIDTLKRFQEKVNTGAEDSVADLLDTFKKKVLNEVFDLSQNWLVSTKRERILFPQNCRFLYTVGCSTIAVIEEAPSIRTLTLDNALLADERTGATRVTSRHALALPYTVFLLHFINDHYTGSGYNRLANLYVTWRNAPLQTLDDALYTPVLPNLHQGCSACMGNNFFPEGENIAQIVNHTISAYWTSSFNTDLSQFWWDKGEVDPRFNTVRSWKEATEDNPLFVLEPSYRLAFPSVEDLLNQCVQAQDEVDETTVLRERLSQSVERCTEQMFEKIMRYYRRTKFERYYPKDITQNLGDSISTISDELIALVISMEMELNALAEEVHRNQKDITHFGWTAKGNYWKPYSEQ